MTGGENALFVIFRYQNGPLIGAVLARRIKALAGT
jgi:hypothetical protein